MLLQPQAAQLKVLLEATLSTAAPHLQAVCRFHNGGLGRRLLSRPCVLLAPLAGVLVVLIVVVLLVLGYDVIAADPGGSLPLASTPAFLLRIYIFINIFFLLM